MVPQVIVNQIYLLYDGGLEIEVRRKYYTLLLLWEIQQTYIRDGGMRIVYMGPMRNKVNIMPLRQILF